MNDMNIKYHNNFLSCCDILNNMSLEMVVPPKASESVTVLGAPVLGAPVLGAPVSGAPVSGAPVLDAHSESQENAAIPITQLHNDEISELTLLKLYERLLFELEFLNREFMQHTLTTSQDLCDIKDTMSNSQKYYYIIARHLCQTNI